MTVGRVVSVDGREREVLRDATVGVKDVMIGVIVVIWYGCEWLCGLLVVVGKD